MSFISLSYLFFFPVVAILFYLLPHRLRWLLLLAASCIFYMAFIPLYILILSFTIVIDYIAAIIIAKSKGPKRKTWLTISIIANISVLAIFKYYNFFLGNFHLATVLPVLKIALPIGLSFHTFQAMAYTIEVYRGNQQPEKHFGIYALYIMFFPQLVAGPIERPQNMLHQFHEKKLFNFDNISSGLRLILWGFFKKMVVADRLALITDQVYASPETHSPTALFLATFFFAFQIYADFSAYSDIAIGSARILGFNLMRNFNVPYQSKSLIEFWRRWHISLSTWFRDYLYVPLGGNKVSISKWVFNIILVFVLSGFWHGANWAFITWGATNGLYILLERFTRKTRHSLIRWIKWEQTAFYNGLKVLVTFGLIMISWIFFRAGSMQDAFLILSKMSKVPSDSFKTLVHHSGKIAIYGFGRRDIVFALLLIMGMYISEMIMNRRSFTEITFFSKRNIRWTLYYLIIFLIVLLGVFEKRDFIYFQF